MNILVYPHELAMGGSQINAFELAAAVRDKTAADTQALPECIKSTARTLFDIAKFRAAMSWRASRSTIRGTTS